MRIQKDLSCEAFSFEKCLDIGAKALYVCKNLKKCVGLLKRKSLSLKERRSSSLFLFFLYTHIVGDNTWRPQTDQRLSEKSKIVYNRVHQ